MSCSHTLPKPAPLAHPHHAPVVKCGVMFVVLFVMTGLTSSASPINHWWLTPLHTNNGDISSANEGVAQHGRHVV